MTTERRSSERSTDGEALFGARLEGASEAPAEAVYELLADLNAHLEWGGRQQKRKNFRLTTVEALRSRRWWGPSSGRREWTPWARSRTPRS
jgi:hypothetical protein